MGVSSKSKNTYDFMALGYFINANNNMYLKTKDKKYIDNNISIIKPILIDTNSNSAYQKNVWVMNVGKNNQNATVNGQEHLISEGYFFRYIGEFLDILAKNNLYTNYQPLIKSGLKYSFNKWKARSFSKYDDYSMLFHQRLHTGANWAIVALYLMKYDASSKDTYSTFVNQFDQELKKALVVNRSASGVSYYTWNSTYPDKFCKALQAIKNYKPVVQDVSHGNHVVLYLIKARELNNANWKDFDFSYLANTLKLKILKTDSIADNVDGTTDPTVKNTGWRISDGWMKLIYYDKSLYPLFEKSLTNYQNRIDNSGLELQFNSIYP
ncbi:hypothetical protein [Chryseobacterium ginsenosidimutans]|uniref:hypothetical protein n=1 Tax=Chryseobacterium ginsenosidimutans TaxID=687846 RepID=UPI0027B8BBA6|nr:hypothetical protein [Chryseobacterium ginsenosidimutans]